MSYFSLLIIQKALLALALCAGMIKLASTLYLIRDAAYAAALLATPMGRMIFYASKLSVLIMILALFLRAYLSGDRQSAILDGSAFIGAVMLTALVVYLRRTRRWFGVAHWVHHAIRKNHS